MNAPKQTVGIYKSVLTYQPNSLEIVLKTSKEELRGPTKNILIPPLEASQNIRLIQNAIAASTRNVTVAER